MEASISTPRFGSAQLSTGSSVRHSMPNSQQDRTQPHPSADRLPKGTLSSLIHQNTLIPAALPKTQRSGTVIKSLLSNNSPGPDGFPGKFFQMFREELTLTLKLFQKIAEERIFPSPFYQATTRWHLNQTKKSEKRKLRADITGEYRCNSPQQNASKPNPTTH